MTIDQTTFINAVALIEHFGTEAGLEARERVCAMQALGSEVGVRMWSAIVQVVDALDESASVEVARLPQNVTIMNSQTRH